MSDYWLKSSKNIHFIGIGGIGLSAVAKMMHLEGRSVSGSDASDSPITRSLSELGIKIDIGHRAENLKDDVELVVRSIAVSDENPEIIRAKELEIPVISYPEALGVISSDKYTISVSGTHGKTTTTAMISEILSSAALSPTVIVGSLLKKEKSNFVKGESELLVVESCEYKKSFLNINPNIIVITNIDNDHLDCYKDLDDIVSTFREFAGKLPKEGVLVVNLKDENLRKIAENSAAKIIDYSLQEISIKLKVFGEHNIENAKAAVSVARVLGVSEKDALDFVSNFEGTWRRLEYKGKSKKGFIVYDDYAHHPTAIRATLKALKDFFPEKKIIVIFQPHLFSRTKILLDEFASSFFSASKVVLAPIYKAREAEDNTISSGILAERIKENGVFVRSFENFKEIEAFVNAQAGEDDIVITLGAGDIYKVGENMLN